MRAILHVSCLRIARCFEGCLTAPYCQPGIKEPLVFSCDAPQHLSHPHWCPTKCFAKFRFLGPLMPSEGDAENSTIGAVLGGRAGWNVLDWVMANYRSEFFSAVELQHHCYTLEAEKSVSGALQVFIFLLLYTVLKQIHNFKIVPVERAVGMSANSPIGRMRMSYQSFIVTFSFLFPGSSSSVLPAARDYPYPRQQEAKHSLLHRGVGACDTNRTQKLLLAEICHTWGKKTTGVSSDITGLFLSWGLWPSVLLLFVNQRPPEEKGEKSLLLLGRSRTDVEVELCRISTRRSNRHLNKCTTECGYYSCWDYYSCWECDRRYSLFYGFIVKKLQDFYWITSQDTPFWVRGS